jgi:hypothetical protein
VKKTGQSGFPLYFNNLLHRLLHWEYWPAWLFNLPILGIWLFFSLRARSLFFFSAVNPTIPTGGVLGESKKDIIRQLPRQWLPPTCFIPAAPASTQQKQIEKWMKAENQSFPIILKPNVGERGMLVKKINRREELASYLEKNRIDYLAQEFVSLPVELSVTYHRFPGATAGTITSLCRKEHLKVTGDGRRSLNELILDYPRARLQREQLKNLHGKALNRIPGAGEVTELVPIGNHCRGATFLDENRKIDQDLTRMFDELSRQMPDIHFGRFDLKCNSLEELKEGRDFRILEFNGIAADPAHVFDPANSIRNAYRDYYRQWKIIYEISREQRKRGVKPMRWAEARRSLTDYIRYKRSLTDYV